MTDPEIIKACAELDGWTKVTHVPTINLTRGIPPFKWTPCATVYTEGTYAVPNYLTSYDAIIPLIAKCEMHSKIRDLAMKLFNAQYVTDLTPTQLCEALLRATGKWIE